MFKPLAIRVSVLGVTVAALALGAAQPAFATDYCVAPIVGCVGTPSPNFETALGDAATQPNSDRIFLAPVTYTAPVSTGYSYNNVAGPVEIIGAGSANGLTKITSPVGGSDKVLALYGGPGTLIRDLRIEPPANSAGGIYGLRTNGTARRIFVQEHVTNLLSITGVVLNGGTLEDSQVLVARYHPGTGVVVDTPGGTIRDSGISGNVGIQASDGATIERTGIAGKQFGLAASRNTTTIRSSVIDTTEGTTATATGIAVSGHPGINTTVIADGVTIEGFPSGLGISANTFDAPADSVDVVLTNSIIRGYTTKLDAAATGAGTAHIAASYSDYAPVTHTGGAHATVSESNISNVGNAAFDDDVLVPLASSPLIDAGDPATAQGLDFRGNPLVTDGNLDGTARRDIGAVEFPGPLPGAGDTPPADPAPAELPAPDPVALPPARDTVAPLVASFRSSHNVFSVTRARTATSARTARGTRFSYVLSEPARVVITIKRMRGGRTVGRLIRKAVSGRNRLAFSGRIGRRALKPGRYRAVLTATDTAGNRSAPKTVTFRVATRSR